MVLLIRFFKLNGKRNIGKNVPMTLHQRKKVLFNVWSKAEKTMLTNEPA